MLEGQFPPLWLRGELSGVLFHRSGHLYLTLKDSQAQISGVMWRTKLRGLKFRPEDGQEVLAYGKLSLFEKGGRYQFDIEAMQPAGKGALFLEFEKLKAKLAAEGLFDQERKRPIPSHPNRIGVATSGSGAAVRDILVTLKRRGFGLDVVFVPVKVQGDGSAEDIARGIGELCALDPRPDLIIVGRGGGSIEDLWAFNEEITVRAVANCPVPVISGVGHETDFTLTDFAADLRAPTPTAAAEQATGDRTGTQQNVNQLATRLMRVVEGTIEGHRLRLQNLAGAYGLNRVPDSIQQYMQHVDEIEGRISRSIDYSIQRQSEKINSLQGKLIALSPKQVLKRGYSVVMTGDKVIKSSKELKINDNIEVVLSDGKIEGNVTKID